MNKLGNLQVIRGVAALCVCFFHSQYLVDIPDKAIVISRFRGTIGIPLFYVISGFVMVFITPRVIDNKWEAAKVFLIKRGIRIIPLFYFSVLLYLIVCHSQIWFFFTAGLGATLKTLLFIPQFTQPAGPAFGFSFFYVSWSLNYEVLFYIVFSVSFLFSKFRYHFIFIYYFVIIFLMPLIGKGYVSASPEVNYNFDFKLLNFLANPIQLCFVSGIAFGIFFAKFYKYITSRSTLLISVIYAIALFSYFAYGAKLIPAFFGSDLIICSLFVYLMIIADFKLKIPFPKFLLYLGDVSYCIYLLHPVVFLYLTALAKRYGLHKLESSWYFAVIGILIVIGISVIVHELVEKKCISYLRKKFLVKVQSAEPEQSKIKENDSIIRLEKSGGSRAVL